jgi:membrane protein implicated in regulation of membrane protease activity
MKTVLLLIGIVALAVGLLWVGQGTGYVPWPKTSFMISDIHWAYYGAGLAVVGVVLISFARRRRDLRRR